MRVDNISYEYNFLKANVYKKRNAIMNLKKKLHYKKEKFRLQCDINKSIY